MSNLWGQQWYREWHVSVCTGAVWGSWHRCPDRSVEYQPAGKEQTCGWSLCPALPQKHPEPLWSCHSHCGQTEKETCGLRLPQKHKVCFSVTEIWLKTLLLCTATSWLQSHTMKKLIWYAFIFKKFCFTLYWTQHILPQQFHWIQKTNWI